MTANGDVLSRRAWIRSAVSLPIFGVLVFGSAGTFAFWQGWLFIFVFVAATSVISIYFLKHDPKLIERRMQIGPMAEQEPAQKIIITITFLGFFLLLILPGLDYRWHWSAVPSWLVIAGNVGVALSYVVFFIVLKQNSYAASTIRVEADQPVVSTGAYAVVRHPLYSGALLLLFCTPLALGSYWTLLLLIPMAAVLAWRLLDEERFLKMNLRGYADYCRNTRYRLIPGIW